MRESHHQLTNLTLVQDSDSVVLHSPNSSGSFALCFLRLPWPKVAMWMKRRRPPDA